MKIWSLSKVIAGLRIFISQSSCEYSIITIFAGLWISCRRRAHWTVTIPHFSNQRVKTGRISIGLESSSADELKYLQKCSLI